MSEIKLPAASGGGSISIKGPASSGSDVDLLDTSGNLNLADGKKLILGTGDDFQIHHDGSGTNLDCTNSNPLYIQSDLIHLMREDGNEWYMKCTKDAAVELYYNNSKKLETTSSGAKINGDTTSVDGGADDLVVGNATSGKNDGITLVSNSSQNGTLAFADQDSSFQGAVGYVHNGDYLRFLTSGTQRVRVDSDGLKFNSDSAAANALDDYETGTFTPKLGGYNNAASYNISGSGNYIKIGDICHVMIYFDNKDLDNNATGTVMIYDLPFTSLNSSIVAGITSNFHTYNVTFASDQRYTFYVSGNTGSWKGLISRNNNTWANWDVADFESSNMYIELHGSYRTA